MRFLPPDSNIPRIFLNSTYRVVCAAVHTTRVTSRECRRWARSHVRAAAFAFLGALTFSVPLRASLDPSLALSQYVHGHWQTQSGLPQNSVSSIAQTSDGYLWVGTEDG